MEDFFHSKNELREASGTYSSEEIPVMGTERRGEQSISWSKARVAKEDTHPK